RFSGANLATVEDVIVGLSSSVYDHMNNQPAFGPDGRLYFVLASNTAMGAPDAVWGFRPERLLTGAVLAADVRGITTPVDVQTEDGGNYDPYAPGAPVTIYATGIRNAYDLVFTSGGHLFAPSNGSAAGGNTPSGPGVPALSGVSNTQHDLLFRVEEGGYYGHPNPLRQEYVLYGGNPTSGADPVEVPDYPVGINPPSNYGGFAYDFGLNVSPNGAIEYNSGGAHFGGALDGKLLVVRYSGGDDILILDVDHSTGNVVGASSGSFGTTGMIDPLDLVQDPATGNLYVVEAGFRTNGGDASGLRISLLKPVAQNGNAVVSNVGLRNNTAHLSAVLGETSPGSIFTLTNTGSGPLALPADAFGISGPGAARFRVLGAPTDPTTLAVGQSISVQVVYEPAVKGIDAATLTIKTNDAADFEQNFDLRGLGQTGLGGAGEPSLQRILDLYELPINVGDPDPETNDYPAQTNVPGSDEITAPVLERAGAGAVTIEILASMGTANDNGKPDTAAVGFYDPANPGSITQLFTVDKQYAQTVDVTVDGVTSFTPTGEFAIAGTFFDFDDRVVYGEDGRNTWENNPDERRKLRLYPLKDEAGNIVPNAYVFAFEEWEQATD
ncbi:MAG: choice-of-anchor D domain-containing protein, partial [Planctomycetota bacterium]